MKHVPMLSDERAKVLVGGWGRRAGELLERTADRRGVAVHRVDALTMLEPPHVVQDNWCCWLFGEPSDGGALTARFGHATRDDLPSAFGRALVEQDETACELLCGRFVVVVVERDQGRCLVARDQLGTQPLVYARSGAGVVFAEHERDLLDLLQRTPSPDRLALLQWIENGLSPVGHTLYEDVRRVPAGHRLTLCGAHASVERWWSLRYAGIENGTPTELTTRLREATFAAISRAAAGSVRPAVKLSGGLDSACVAAGLAANGFAGRALAMGGTFSGHPEADESALIEATANHTRLSLELTAFDPNSSMLGPALAHIARWRLPPSTPNLFLWQPLMMRARQLGVDVLLDGEGGDELFGFAPHLIADMLHAGRLPTAWSLTGRIPGIGLNPNREARLRVLRHYGLGPLVPISMQRRREERARHWFPASMIPRDDAQALADLRAANQDRRDGPLWWRMLVEKLIDTHDLLDLAAHFRREATDEDLERRHPFLYDLRLTEAMLRVPPQEQFDAARDRPLLRNALRSLVPEAVLIRHAKSHFTPLVLAGLRADESGLVEPLRRSDAPVRAYVRPDALDDKVSMAADERAMRDAGPLWRVAIANRWLISQAHDGS